MPLLYAGGLQKSGEWYFQIRPMKVSPSNVMWAGYGAKIGHGVEALTRVLAGRDGLKNLRKIAEAHFNRMGSEKKGHNSAPNEVRALQGAGFFPVEMESESAYGEAIDSGKPIALYPNSSSEVATRYPLVYAIVPLERPTSPQPLIIDRTRRRLQDRPSILVGETITAMNQEAMARFIVLQMERLHHEDRVQIIDLFASEHMPHWMAGRFNPRLIKRVEIKKDGEEWKDELLQVLMSAQHPVLVEAIFSQMRDGFWVDFI